MSSSPPSQGGWGGAGGAGGRPTFDQILWMGLGSNPGQMTSWSALGTIGVALVTGKILMDTGRYYDYFGSTDKRWVRGGVAVGSLSAVAQLVICCVQTWKLIHHAFTDFSTISALDGYLGNVSDLMGACLNFATSTYYTWRAYKMSGQKWWLGAFLMLLNAATLVMGLTVAVKGMTAPRVTLETAIKLRDFNLEIKPLRKSWGALANTSDGLVFLTMLFFLFRSRDSVFHQEKKIYHKLNTLIIETMLPPVICILLLDIHTDTKGSPTADWRRVLRMLLPSLYYVSLIHSLVSRYTIRKMLDDHLASEGVHHTSGGGVRSTGSVFVATYPTAGGADADVDKKDRDLEASTDHLHVVPFEKVQSYDRSASPISASSHYPTSPHRRF